MRMGFHGADFWQMLPAAGAFLVISFFDLGG
jgi:hypothetical protein